MTVRGRRWLIGGGVLLLAAAATGYVAVARLSRRFEPYIREQAVEYLKKRFASEVELAELKVRLPRTSPWRLFLQRGRGATARVEGRGLILRQGGRRDVPPLFEMDRFAFDLDVGALFDEQKTVPRVVLYGV
ncbi:MAG: hypothetical protein IT538_07930, partial [Variibacter sp.]|nr:hypothetical protein [Variibacter sp.]